MLEGAVEIKWLWVLEQLHPVLALAGVAAFDELCHVVRDTDPGEVLRQVGQGVFGSCVGERIVKDPNDVQPVFFRWYGAPALDLALADLKPLCLSGMRAVAGCALLKLGELLSCEQVRVLLLEDVVQEVDVHVGVLVAVLEWRVWHVQFLSGGDALRIAGGTVECAGGRRLTRR